MSRVLLALAGAMLAGCVSVEQIPMSASLGEALRGKELALSEREKPDFAAMTPTRGAFALAGAAVSISEGNKLIRENGVEDPAGYIARALAAGLEARYSTRLSPRGAPVASDDVSDIVKNAPGSDLVLDVRTLNWSFVYFPTVWAIRSTRPTRPATTSSSPTPPSA